MKHAKTFVPERYVGPGNRVDGEGNVHKDPVVKRRCSLCLLNDLECTEHKIVKDDEKTELPQEEAA